MPAQCRAVDSTNLVLKIALCGAQTEFCALVRFARAATEQIFEFSVARSARRVCRARLQREVSSAAYLLHKFNQLNSPDAIKNTSVLYSPTILSDMIACYLALETSK